MDNLTPSQDSKIEQGREFAQAAGQGVANAPEATARIQTLARKSGIRFVNGMRNMLWIAGFVAAVDDDTVIMLQTNNPETGIRIKVDPIRYSTKQLHGRPLSMQAHVTGYRDEHGPQVQVYAFNVERPSLMDIPAEKVWLSGFGKDPKKQELLRKIAKNELAAFTENGVVKEEYREFFSDVGPDGRPTIDPKTFAFVQAYRMFGEMAEISGGVVDSRIGSGQNYCTVAGLIDAKAWVPENKYRRGYGQILLRQHKDPDTDLVVRVTDPRAERWFASRRIYEGALLVVNGSVRRKVYPRDDDPTQIASAHTYIEVTDIGDIKHGVFGQDLLRIPEWWQEIKDRMLARREAQRAAAAAAAARKAAQSQAATTRMTGILDDDFVEG